MGGENRRKSTEASVEAGVGGSIAYTFLCCELVFRNILIIGTSLVTYGFTCHFLLKALDDRKPVYSEAELQQFEAELRDKEIELGRRAASLQHEEELLRERGKALEAQKKEYQQVRRVIRVLLAVC